MHIDIVMWVGGCVGGWNEDGPVFRKALEFEVDCQSKKMGLKRTG